MILFENRNTLRQLRLAVQYVLSSAHFLDYFDFETEFSVSSGVKLEV